MDASKIIDHKIASLKDWRGQTLAAIRRIVHEADPKVAEEWKWMGTPTWSHEGILCIANTHKQWVNVVFPKGASIPDPDKLFNAFLEGGTWRAVKFVEGDKINEPSLKNLIRAALALNLAKSKAGKPKGSRKLNKTPNLSSQKLQRLRIKAKKLDKSLDLTL